MGTIADDDCRDHVNVDNRRVGEIAAEHLACSGAKHCAYLSMRPAGGPFKVRGDAFLSALADRGARGAVFSKRGLGRTDDKRNMVNRTVLKSLLRDILSARPRISGIFCCADMLTASLYSIFQEEGIRPGKDIHIVSCNNESSILAGLYPRPATIDIHAETIGARAVEQLAWRIRNRNEPTQNTIVEPTLIPGVDT